MFKFETLLKADPASGVVIMPLAPAAVVLPAHAPASALFPFLEEVAKLHLAAFVALYGPPPQSVKVQKVEIADPGAEMLPRYTCSFAAPLSESAACWVTVFRDGLEHWSEANFPYPISQESAGVGQTTFAVAPFDQVMEYACYAYYRAGKINALRNLARYFEGLVPPSLDPDRVGFRGPAKERRE